GRIDNVLGIFRIAADVPLALPGQSQRIDFTQDIAKIQVGIGDGFDVLAAHVTEIALVAGSHARSVGSRSSVRDTVEILRYHKRDQGCQPRSGVCSQLLRPNTVSPRPPSAWAASPKRKPSASGPWIRRTSRSKLCLLPNTRP